MRKNTKQLYWLIFLLAFLLLILFCGCSAHRRKIKQNTETNEFILNSSRAEPVRIGYLESEPYALFARETEYAAEQLSLNGYLNFYEVTGEADSSIVWENICNLQCGREAEFLANAYYVFSDMSEEERSALLERGDIDILFVMGTAAGKWLSSHADRISYDYMVFASADPVSAGITAGEEIRLNDKSFAHIDPGRISRQIEMACELFQFSDVGVVYMDDAAAYSYSGIAQLEDAAEKYGFSIHKLHVKEPLELSDYDRYYRELKKAYEKLIPQIDLLYITTGKIEDEKLPWLLEEVHKAGIITVAETSEEQVKYGALMHVSLTNMEEEGAFAGITLADYIKGTDISKLKQVYEFTPKLSFNYDTIKTVGAEVPMKILLLADSVYKDEKNWNLKEK